MAIFLSQTHLAIEYKSTATYYWSLIDQNGFVSDSVTGFVDAKDNQSKSIQNVAGPFGFDEAIKLGDQQVIYSKLFLIYTISFNSYITRARINFVLIFI